jgi:hypothetical protein
MPRTSASTFLSEIATADGKYLEHFVFDPGGKKRQLCYTFLRVQPRRHDWDRWINFWHAYTTMSSKLKTPLGKWIHLTHRLWHWYFNKDKDELYHICGGTVRYFRQASGWRCTHSTTMYQFMQKETSAESYPTGVPTSVIAISETKVNKASGRGNTTPSPYTLCIFWGFYCHVGRKLDVE